ncbi:MAG: NADPH-dependent 7-cyano-7-deazaguanine reductase QueF [Chitinivibrionales bacterium]|nr:NADPH-dependent 7-cyano-7-deazaguanine reductase QueF [Chitinivibrionales bacterium]MBD3358643.1 NADPH-dependent 7-cyano-7-deazaguanine reductase QueF [Chitinivibrionales bacterium]
MITPLNEALDQGILPDIETFPCPYASEKSRSGVIRILFPEFTCVCPKTGYPDFAAIGLYYLPDRHCIELKSWKLYLNAFRMIGAFHEAVTSHLFRSVCNIVEPRWALVVGDFYPRGNVDTTVLFETDTPRPQGADLLLDRYEPRCVVKGSDRQR